MLVEEWGGPDRDDLGNLVAAGPGSYRLRMHARGRDQAHANVVAPGSPIEEHLPRIGVLAPESAGAFLGVERSACGLKSAPLPP